jgi:ArsR family transcriptional regulator
MMPGLVTPVMSARPAHGGATVAAQAPAPLAPGDARALQAAAGEAAALLRALANPERLVLLCALVDGERCVTDLALATAIRQPTLSQQLGVLRDEGIVATRREGRFIHYRIADEAAFAVLGVLHRLYCPAHAA